MTINRSNIGQDAYNKFYQLPELGYNIISYLITENELIWKLLKYPTNDAWNKSNLTSDEKRALIYDGSPINDNITNFRIFMDTGQPDAWTHEDCIIRICPYFAKGINRTTGVVEISFEVYCHYKINTLSNYKTRVDTIAQQFLEVFNGVEVGGLGKLYFDRLGDQGNKLAALGAVPFKGKQVIMSTNIGGN